MPASQVLYSATVPLDGAATRAKFEKGKEERGLVPYFVSGPLSRKGMLVGFLGTVLHVAAWLMAVIFDIIIGAAIKQDQSPGAFTYWIWGFVTLLIGFVSLLGVTIFHAVSAPENKIPEGGAPPFLMSLFIGGTQISLILTILSMIASTGGTNNDYYYVNQTLTVQEQEDERNAQRQLLVLSLLSKVYVVQFLKNNQEWAGPAEALKSDL